MNNLEALIIVRGAARVSGQMRTKQGQAALKVVDRKIQSLLRKKAWRDGVGTTPVHMESEDFLYRIPDDPLAAAMRVLLRKDQTEEERREAVTTAEKLLAEIDQLGRPNTNPSELSEPTLSA
jgi:hypothetical protein